MRVEIVTQDKTKSKDFKAVLNSFLSVLFLKMFCISKHDKHKRSIAFELENR